MDDAAVVGRQLGRAPRAFRRVVVRCPFGRPAVTEQELYDEDGKPFPTTYWLTCPHLVAAVSRLEAAGGVERWSRAVRHDPELADSLGRATDEQRTVRRELARRELARRELARRGAGGHTTGDGSALLELGIGGSSRRGSLKCLHAHVAFALARPGYVVGERILAEVEAPWPSDDCCSA